MSARGKRRGTYAYAQGAEAFADGIRCTDAHNPYQYGDNWRAWNEGWGDAEEAYKEQQAREPDDRMRELLMTIRARGDDVSGTTELADAIADAIEMIWEKVK